MQTKDISPEEAQECGQGGVDPKRPDLAVVQGERQAVDPEAARMPQGGLTNEEISLLCDIGERKNLDSTPRALVDTLKAKGYIEPASHPGRGVTFQLTQKAQQFLLERGAGLDEA
jgi:hypothetical protein